MQNSIDEGTREKTGVLEGLDLSSVGGARTEAGLKSAQWGYCLSHRRNI